jgi:hypothetical protein
MSALERGEPRGMWAIVARREFVERGRDKGFLISTAITLLILVGIIVITAIFNRGTTFDLVVAGEGSREIADQVVIAADALEIEVTIRTAADAEAAARAVRDGEVDAALVDGERIVVESEPPAQLVAVIQAVALRERSRSMGRSSRTATGWRPASWRRSPPGWWRCCSPRSDPRSCCAARSWGSACSGSCSCC